MSIDRMEHHRSLVSNDETAADFRRWVLTTGLAMLFAKCLWLFLYHILLFPVTHNELTLYENFGMAADQIAVNLAFELPIYAACILYLKVKSAETHIVPGVLTTFGLAVSPLLPLLPLGAIFVPEWMGYFVFCGLVTATLSTVCSAVRRKAARVAAGHPRI